MSSNLSENDTVLVGKKPLMNYVIACLTLFDSNISPIKVKARGLAISRAVDAVELLRRAFIKDLKIKIISTDTLMFTKRSGIDRSISTIEIVISKPDTR
ncbi:DNA-binding protein Alba [Candidatus Bathyarchaeota archaeon]|jgi:DNA-binding protein|nr:MAG: DNA-binding protein Alba [Candidatus Bathyarchaeota archaeon]